MIPQLPDTITNEDLDLLYTKLGLRTAVANEYLRLSLRHVLLFDKKQLDYGPHNIVGFGLFGIVVRMNDKFERLKNLFKKGRRRKAINESIRDTFSDIHVYSNIAMLYDLNLWPRQEKDENNLRSSKNQ